ncbi:MAG TPA: hypothetical protein EYP59_15645 [Thiotrichaceae bacterium]|nr:hypothetical protein [Thiotrichaceae bacterium]
MGKRALNSVFFVETRCLASHLRVSTFEDFFRWATNPKHPNHLETRSIAIYLETRSIASLQIEPIQLIDY